MHPIGALLLLTFLGMILAGSRRSALIAMIAGVLYLTQGQTIDVGINFFAVRIMSVALFARVIFRHEFSFAKMHRIDRALLILYSYTAVIVMVRSNGTDLSTLATAIDSCLCYFGFRGVIKTEDDFRWLLKRIVWLLIPYALLVGIERVQGRSVFIFMGGVTGGWTREGVTRCMAAFRYPVALGTFGGTFLALYIALWFSRPERRYAYAGIVLSLWLVYASNSGGSITAAGVALVAWLLWYIRKDMRKLRWGILVALAIMAMIMKAPVWYVLDRISFGGDSWHRAYLIDVAMRNIGKWWLIGMDAIETANWFPYTVNGTADITNEYLVFGLSGGLLAMVLFVILISRAFGRVGATLGRLRRTGGSKSTAYLVWGLGVVLGVHVITWFGVSYFDQMYVVWLLQLAAVVSVTDNVWLSRTPLSRTVEREPVRVSSAHPEPVIA